jgi:hypothetical protein
MLYESIGESGIQVPGIWESWNWGIWKRGIRTSGIGWTQGDLRDLKDLRLERLET